jgi:endoglucanase
VLLSLVLLGEIDAHATSTGTTAAKAAAARFLSHYVLTSGRIERIDQGGDTVSAGQAYGLLLSEAVGKRQTFALVWRWTEAHLMRRDGLLASHWSRGRVVDSKSASDADLDAARALILAGRRFHITAYRQAGLAMGRAILAHETERLGRRLVLLAGSWARKPAVVDPGYWAPRTLELLTAATHDQQFARLEQGAVSLAADLTANPPSPRLGNRVAKRCPGGARGSSGPPPRGDSSLFARRRSRCRSASPRHATLGADG